MTDERCDLICIDAPRAESIRGSLILEESAREAADRARALSDPTRLMLAAALREGEELCVCDLSWILLEVVWWHRQEDQREILGDLPVVTFVVTPRERWRCRVAL